MGLLICNSKMELGALKKRKIDMNLLHIYDLLTFNLWLTRIDPLSKRISREIWITRFSKYTFIINMIYTIFSGTIISMSAQFILVFSQIVNT